MQKDTLVNFYHGAQLDLQYRVMVLLSKLGSTHLIKGGNCVFRVCMTLF